METTINIDLNDPRSLEIAEVLGNKTCKSILTLITEEELTETDISSKLKIPLNTVDYNVKKLVKAGLIESTNHFWSIRGKKIPSYKVANKKIIISPRSFSSKIIVIPALIIGGILALGVRFFSATSSTEQVSQETADSSVAQISSIVANEGVASNTLAVGNELVAQKAGLFSSLAGWEWFLVGIWLGVVLLFALDYLNDKWRLNKK